MHLSFLIAYLSLCNLKNVSAMAAIFNIVYKDYDTKHRPSNTGSVYKDTVKILCSTKNQKWENVKEKNGYNNYLRVRELTFQSILKVLRLIQELLN